MATRRVSNGSLIPDVARDIGPRSGALQSVSISHVLLPSVVFLVVPAQIAQANDLGVLQIPWQLWVVFLGQAVFASLVLVAVQVGLSAIGVGRSFALLVRVLFFFVVWCGLVLPIAEAGGMEEFRSVDLEVRALLFGVIVTVVAFALSESRLGKHFRRGVAVFLAANVVVIVAAGGIGDGAGIDAAATLSSTRNLIVVSFDGVSRAAMSDALDSNPDLGEGLRNFTLFEGVASSSPATLASLAAELYGNQDFSVSSDTVDQVWETAPDRLITNALAEGGFRVTTYGTYGHKRGPGVALVRPAEALNITFESLSGSAWVRIAGPHVPSIANPPQAVRDWLSSVGRPSEVALSKRIDSSHTELWDRALTMSAIDLDRFVNDMAVGDAQPAAVFLHFTHTHFPVEWDGKCQFQGDHASWFNAHQNYQGAVAEAECVLRQMNVIVEKLENLGVLDRTMLVFKSDHGVPSAYAEPGSPNTTRINGHDLWGLSRYAPFLAIKEIGAEHQELVRDDSPVMLDDLAHTTCEELSVFEDCSHYPGANLTDFDPAHLETMDAVVFVVRSAASSHEFQDHVAVRFQRGEDILTSLLHELKLRGFVESSRGTASASH